MLLEMQQHDDEWCWWLCFYATAPSGERTDTRATAANMYSMHVCSNDSTHAALLRATAGKAWKLSVHQTTGSPWSSTWCLQSERRCYLEAPMWPSSSHLALGKSSMILAPSVANCIHMRYRLADNAPRRPPASSLQQAPCRPS